MGEEETGKKQGNGVVETTEIRLVNAAGRLVARLAATDKGATLEMFDAGGKPRATLETTNSGAELVLLGRGSHPILLHVDEAQCYVELKSASGRAILQTVDGMTRFGLTNDKTRIETSLDGSSSLIALRSSTGSVTVNASEASTGLKVKSDSHHATIELRPKEGVQIDITARHNEDLWSGLFASVSPESSILMCRHNDRLAQISLTADTSDISINRVDDEVKAISSAGLCLQKHNDPMVYVSRGENSNTLTPES